MADRAQLFKTSAKQIGLFHGVIASFMAKPYNDLPGCSGHLHFSLRDIAAGVNKFADTKQESPADGYNANMSPTMQHFLAGMIKGLPSILAILAPTVNR
jgi:glutamine synthetase